MVCYLLAKVPGERGDIGVPPQAGKGDLQRSGSSDSTWVGASVTVAKSHHIQEQPVGSTSDQEHGQTGPTNRVQHISQGVAWQFVQQLAQAGHAGKASGQGAVPILATQLVDIALSGDNLAMVSTHGKAVTRRNVPTHTEVPH